MKRQDLFGTGKYLKAADLNGNPKTAVIERVTHEILKNGSEEKRKTVLHLSGMKPFPINATNWDSVVAMTGEEDDDNWPGYKIEIYPTTTTMNGQLRDCVRIRPPDQGELMPEAKVKKAKPKPADDLDDEIPFA